MAVIRISMDTSLSLTGSLSPLVLEIVSGTLDLFYFVCLREQHPYELFISPSAYGAEIDQISFTNPLDIWATLKNISTSTANAVLDRTLFYKQERQRRKLINMKLEQEVIDLALKNAEKIPRVKRKLIKGGVSEKSAEKFLGQLLSEQSLSMQLEPPEHEPPQRELIRTRLR